MSFLICCDQFALYAYCVRIRKYITRIILSNLLVYQNHDPIFKSLKFYDFFSTRILNSHFHKTFTRYLELR